MAFQQVHTAVQATLLFGPYDPVDRMLLEVSVVNRDFFFLVHLAVSYRGIIEETFVILEQGSTIYYL